MEPSILWYDLETFGTNPFHDRIAQFAAIRTNFNFEQVGEAHVLYCRPADDYLPNPEACLVTGIGPTECAEKGIGEYEFAKNIYDIMMVPGTTAVGYNSIKFDDEFIRNLFYRNLFDPYSREYENGNSRWDIIDLARAARDLRPGSMNWPLGENGSPLFKLEALSAANNIAHEHAHDALSDVFATIGIAKMIKTEDPRLFHWAFSSRNRENLRKLFDLNIRPALVYSAARLTRAEGCTTLICPLGVPGEKSRQGRNTILCADLRYNPREILNLPAEEIRKRIFLPSPMEDSEHRRFPVYDIKINRCPFIAPLNTLREGEAAILGIDIDQCLARREILLREEELTTRIREIFNNPPASTLPDDPDYQIYSSFIKNTDRKQLGPIHEQLEIIAAADTNGRRELLHTFIPHIQNIKFSERERIGKLLNRLLGRSFGEDLSGKVAKNWRRFCQNRLIFPLLDEAMDINRFQKTIAALQETSTLEQKFILKDLLVYFEALEKRVLK
ncbi:MAG: exodeoxyribonuclease I [Salinispira sp.]